MDKNDNKLVDIFSKNEVNDTPGKNPFKGQTVVVSDILPPTDYEDTTFFKAFPYHHDMVLFRYLQDVLGCNFIYWGKSRRILANMRRAGIRNIKKRRYDFPKTGNIWVAYPSDSAVAYCIVFAGKTPDEMVKWVVWYEEIFLQGFFEYLKKNGSLYSGCFWEE